MTNENHTERTENMTAAPMITPREELNISPSTAELLESIDAIDDGDDVAQALEMALLALVDIGGRDLNRPKVASPTKLANRALSRIQAFIEMTIERQSEAGDAGA